MKKKDRRADKPAPYTDKPAPSPPDLACSMTVREPATVDKLNELLMYVGDLEAELNLMRSSLFGTKLPPVLYPAGQGVDGMAATACSRVASMVGDARTINGLLARS